MLLASIWDVSASLRCTVIVCGHTFYSGAVTLKLFVTFAVLYFVSFCLCVLVCVCVYVCACMYKRNPSVEHHPIAKFLEAAKVKKCKF